MLYSSSVTTLMALKGRQDSQNLDISHTKSNDEKTFIKFFVCVTHRQIINKNGMKYAINKYMRELNDSFIIKAADATRKTKNFENNPYV